MQLCRFDNHSLMDKILSGPPRRGRISSEHSVDGETVNNGAEGLSQFPDQHTKHHLARNDNPLPEPPLAFSSSQQSRLGTKNHSFLACEGYSGKMSDFSYRQ